MIREDLNYKIDFYLFWPNLLENFDPENIKTIVFDPYKISTRFTVHYLLMKLLSQSIKNGSHEFEIKGNPFWCESTEAIQTRFLMIKILENLLEKGFRVQTAINPSSRLINKSLMIFRCVYMMMKYFWIYAHELDILRVVDQFKLTRNFTTAISHTNDLYLIIA